MREKKVIYGVSSTSKIDCIKQCKRNNNINPWAQHRWNKSCLPLVQARRVASGVNTAAGTSLRKEGSVRNHNTMLPSEPPVATITTCNKSSHNNNHRCKFGSYYQPPPNLSCRRKIIICVAFFFQILPNLHGLHPLDSFSYLLLHSSHHGSVGSASAWQTRGLWIEPVLMRYIFSGKYPVFSGRFVHHK